MTRVPVRPLDGVRAIGYLRVSTERQAGEDRTSLTDQRRAVLTKAERLGVVVGEWFQDPGVSGATVEKRPGFLSMLASCVAHPCPASRPGYVIALNDSRWGRFDDPEEAAYWRFEFKRRGWIVRFAEGDEIEDATGRSIVRVVGSAEASKFRANLRQRTIDGVVGHTVNGYWVTGAAPFGYVRKVCTPGRERILLPGVRKASDEDVKLWPDDAGPAEFVRRMFGLYASGAMGLQGIAELGAAEWPAHGWDTGAVYHKLTNRVYLGVLESKGDAQHPEPYRCEDAHPSLVDVETFERVAARLRANTRGSKPQSRPYVLKGLIRCSACGLPLVGGGTKRSRKGLAHYYRCGGLRKLPKTPCTHGGSIVDADRLEGAVRDLLLAEFQLPEVRRAVRRAIDAYLDALESAAATPATDPIDAAITVLEGKIRRLASALEAGTFTEAEVGARIAALRAQLTEAQAERRQVARLADYRAQRPVDRDELYRLVDAMPTLLRDLTGSDARGAVEPWIESATFGRYDRVLTVAIRRVPETGVVALDPLSRMQSNHTNRPEVVTRQVSLAVGRGRAHRRA